MTLPKIIKNIKSDGTYEPCSKCGCEEFEMKYIDTWNPLSRLDKRLMISCVKCHDVVWPLKEKI